MSSGRPISRLQCWECAGKIDKKQMRQLRAEGKGPECYNPKCRRIRAYIHNIDHYRAKNREYHRYNRFRADACALCQSTELLETHHVQPQVLGGKDTRLNCLTLCHHCHKIIGKYYNAIGLHRARYKE